MRLHLLIIAVLALAIAVLWTAIARAQDGRHGVGHAQHHDWYRGLMQPGSGASCCSNKDCRPTRAWRDDDGWWRAELDGRWIIVPPSKVLRTIAPDGNSHICANETGVIFCFVGGVPKS